MWFLALESPYGSKLPVTFIAEVKFNCPPLGLGLLVIPLCLRCSSAKGIKFDYPPLVMLPCVHVFFLRNQMLLIVYRICLNCVMQFNLELWRSLSVSMRLDGLFVDLVLDGLDWNNKRILREWFGYCFMT